MAEILSQKEIDSLLAGVSRDDDASSFEQSRSQEKDGRDVVTFDFRLPHRLSKNQLRTLHTIHESFSETFGSYLVGRLQSTVTIQVTSVDQLFYSEYVLSIASPSSLYVFRIKESDALAILELSPELVLAMVARLLGGTAEPEKKSRTITKIEQSIVQGVIEKALATLQKAWKTISPLTFGFDRYESEGEFAQIAPASEIVLVVSFEVTIGDSKYLMNLCFPTFALDDVLAKINTQYFSGVESISKSNKSSKVILNNLEETKIAVRGILGETSISLQDLIELSEGDVLTTPVPITGEMEFVVGGKKRLLGKPGISNNRYSIKITRMHSNSDNGAEK